MICGCQTRQKAVSLWATDGRGGILSLQWGEGQGPLPCWSLWLFSAEESWPRQGGPQESLSLQASEPEGQVWLL